ncbi:thyroid hormone receptor-associated protein 3 [Sigmodon hispidus]
MSGGAGYQSGTHQGQFDHGSGSLSTSKKSPVGKSPSATGSAYGSSQKEKSSAPGGVAYTKRYLEEQKTENGKDKEQKQTNADKEKLKEKGSFSDADVKMKSDPFASKRDTEKTFRGSQSPKRYKLRDDFEKKMADFHKEEMDEQDKDKSKGRKDPEFDDEPKFMSKVIASKNQEEEKSGKWESLVHTGKEKQRKAEELEEEPFTERSRKEELGGARRSESGHRGSVPEKNFRVTAYKAVQGKNSSPPPRKTSESKDKLGNKGDFSSSGKSFFSITRKSQVSVRMDSFDEDLARPSGLLAQERKLCPDLVHSNKKEQEFRSIFRHIQSAQSQRSHSELFAQHIVTTIVHHVKEHHFGFSGMTFHERFSKYLKRGNEQEAAKNKKSPEIHRRIDISPSTFRKHGLTQEELKSPREPGYKAEGKYKDDPVDLRLDIERRKKHKERDLKRAEEYPEEAEEREESTTGFDKSRLGTKVNEVQVNEVAELGEPFNFEHEEEVGAEETIPGRFMFRKSSTSPKWAHDKFSGEEGEIEEDESRAENREEKDSLQPTAE